MISSRLLGREGPGASSYSMFISFSAFSTLQHAPVLSHSSLQRWSLTGNRPPLVDRTDPTLFETTQARRRSEHHCGTGPAQCGPPDRDALEAHHDRVGATLNQFYACRFDSARAALVSELVRLRSGLLCLPEGERHRRTGVTIDEERASRIAQKLRDEAADLI